MPLRGQCFQRVARVDARLFLLSCADRRRVGLGDQIKALVFAPAAAAAATTTDMCCPVRLLLLLRLRLKRMLLRQRLLRLWLRLGLRLLRPRLQLW